MFDIKEIFDKKRCLAFLKNKTVKNSKNLNIDLEPALMTLEAYNPRKLLVLSAYLEDLITQKNSNIDNSNIDNIAVDIDVKTLTNQLNIVSNLLTIKPDRNYFIENFIFYRCMAYGFIKKDLGRLYGYESSVQNLKRELRWYLFNDDYVDVDLVNAHPSILLDYAIKHSINSPILKSLVNGRNTFYTSAASELQIDVTKLKQLVLIVLNTDKYIGKSTVLEALSLEIIDIRENLWCEFSDSETWSPITKTPQFKRKSQKQQAITLQAFYCQTRESELLLALNSYLNKVKLKVEETQPPHFIPFFDGALIRYTHPTNHAAITPYLEDFNQLNGGILKFSIKLQKPELKILNEEKLCQYENLLNFFNVAEYSQLQRIFFTATSKNPNLLIDKVLAESVALGSSIKQKEHSELTKQLDKVTRDIVTKNQKSKTKTISETERLLIQKDIKKLQDYQQLLRQKRRDCFYYDVTNVEKERSFQKVGKLFYYIRSILLPYSTTPTTLSNFIGSLDNSPTKEEENNDYFK